MSSQKQANNNGNGKKNVAPASIANLKNGRSTRFQPGQSGNPGGNYKHTPKISNAYARFLAMSPEDLKNHKPVNVAEEIALEQVKNAKKKSAGEMVNLAVTKEITDRTEGRALQRVQVDNTTELERLVIRVQERVLAQSGIQIDHEQALQIVTSYRPELVTNE